MFTELDKKIRYIEIFTNKVVNDLLAGEYHSVFKGYGMEFDEVREYQHGDAIRFIDWKITARYGRPFVKRYVEEREKSLYFIVDLSPSGCFGSVQKTKNEIAAELCALLAFSAIKNNDKVGLLIFTDHVEHVIPPSKGSQHVLRMVRDLLSFTPKGNGTNIAHALDYFGHLHLKRSVAFLVSDFQDNGFEDQLSIVARKHDLIAVSLNDPVENELPDVGLVTLKDAETGRVMVLDSSSSTVRKRYKQAVGTRTDSLSAMFLRRNIDQVKISTEHNLVDEIIRFFKLRENKGRLG